MCIVFYLFIYLFIIIFFFAAVRFGRVPKKEKAKIMEQMKRVNAQSQMNLVDSTLDSDPDFLTKIVRAHFQNCDFTREKLRDMCAKAYASPDYIACPAHMVSTCNKFYIILTPL